ncbi:MAG: lamin tail domain-containing protein, partial [Candidatus Sumerlaeota bacterium]|nr:lamin tail domain-containing protein [Candidatus Sumerlaeota bacterium]
ILRREAAYFFKRSLQKILDIGGGVWSLELRAIWLIALLSATAGLGNRPAFAAAPQNVIITEIMADANGDDLYKEWFELYNTTGAAIDINGWTIRDNQSDLHTIVAGGALMVPSHGYLTLGASSNPTLNGGVLVNYAYGTSFTLGNTGDEIILMQGAMVIHSVAWGTPTTAPIPIMTDTRKTVEAGQSIGMAGNYYAGLPAAPGDQWIDQFSPYGTNGDRGTPGRINDAVYVGPGTDTTPPAIIDAWFTGSDKIEIRFNDLLITTGAQNALNYSLDRGVGSPMLATALSQTKVELQFATPLAPMVDYTLSVSGLSDIYGNTITQPVLRTVRMNLPRITISEVMYFPPDGSKYEFIELHNPGATPVQLNGECFTGGIDYTFPAGTVIAPNGYLLVVRGDDTDNFAEFRSYYGLTAGVPIVGPYSGKLSDTGDEVTLMTSPTGMKILSFIYDTKRGWPLAAQGVGHSIVPLNVDNQPAGSLYYPGAWRASTYIKGSPGAADPQPPLGLTINEFMAHTDYMAPPYDSNDWIELYNASTQDIVLGSGWYLSDTLLNLKVWQIPPGTTIPSRKWISFDEINDFHNPITTGFGLNKAGEMIFLSYLPGGAQDRIVDCIDFMGQENFKTLSRIPDGGPWWFTAFPTRDTANGPWISNVVIDEIMYHPKGTEQHPEDNDFDEYIELWNPTTRYIGLWGETSTGTWELHDAVDYSFPDSVIMAPDERILLVGFDPTSATLAQEFQSRFNVPPAVRLFGPWSGALSNSGERIALMSSLDPDLPGDPIVWVLVDELIYFDQSPFDRRADGTGWALQRRNAAGATMNPQNWIARPPTPGRPPLPDSAFRYTGWLVY